MSLQVGPEQKDLLADLARRATWIAETRSQVTAQSGTRVVLLPETLSTWWEGTGHQVAQAIPDGQTWRVGVSLPLRSVGLMADALVAVRHDSQANPAG
ncbi:hypothetical protein HER14_05065 [Acidithiobacillus thiooxidans]|uniref:hypothetical protein n=1 Tax=Acidithiobacillus thiooxidans TaxID=930 RepID=UPI001C06ABE8|nr:hypothetical protein [Acidithiobacillus thiooxidans]MBU2750324.1 hypothetical protein [Acidithiobacillus thiooxidans]